MMLLSSCNFSNLSRPWKFSIFQMSAIEQRDTFERQGKKSQVLQSHHIAGGNLIFLVVVLDCLAIMRRSTHMIIASSTTVGSIAVLLFRLSVLGKCAP